jgi:hypothetical protein
VVVVGVDTHKATHTLVGVDAGGRKLSELTVRATTDGHLKALGWARRAFGLEIVWGIEDCRNLSLRLERDLLDASHQVWRHPHHPLTSIEQLPLQPRGQATAILNTPHQIGAEQLTSPTQRLQMTGAGRSHRQLAELAAPSISPHQRVSGLMRINTDNNHDRRPP